MDKEKEIAKNITRKLGIESLMPYVDTDGNKTKFWCFVKESNLCFCDDAGNILNREHLQLPEGTIALQIVEECYSLVQGGKTPVNSSLFLLRNDNHITNYLYEEKTILHENCTIVGEERVKTDIFITEGSFYPVKYRSLNNLIIDKRGVVCDFYYHFSFGKYFLVSYDTEDNYKNQFSIVDFNLNFLLKDFTYKVIWQIKNKEFCLLYGECNKNEKSDEYEYEFFNSLTKEVKTISLSHYIDRHNFIKNNGVQELCALYSDERFSILNTDRVLYSGYGKIISLYDDVVELKSRYWGNLEPNLFEFCDFRGNTVFSHSRLVDDSNHVFADGYFRVGNNKPYLLNDKLENCWLRGISRKIHENGKDLIQPLVPCIFDQIENAFSEDKLTTIVMCRGGENREYYGLYLEDQLILPIGYAELETLFFNDDSGDYEFYKPFTKKKTGSGEKCVYRGRCDEDVYEDDIYESFGITLWKPTPWIKYQVNGKFGLVYSGSIVSEPVFDQLKVHESYSSFDKYLFEVSVNGRKGVVSKDEVLIPPKYKEIRDFWADTELYRRDGKLLYSNPLMVEIVERNHMCTVLKDKNENLEFVDSTGEIIDKSSMTIFKGVYTTRKDEHDLYDYVVYVDPLIVEHIGRFRVLYFEIDVYKLDDGSFVFVDNYPRHLVDRSRIEISNDLMTFVKCQWTISFNMKTLKFSRQFIKEEEEEEEDTYDDWGQSELDGMNEDFPDWGWNID